MDDINLVGGGGCARSGPVIETITLRFQLLNGKFECDFGAPIAPMSVNQIRGCGIFFEFYYFNISTSPRLLASEVFEEISLLSQTIANRIVIWPGPVLPLAAPFDVELLIKALRIDYPPEKQVLDALTGHVPTFDELKLYGVKL